MLNLFGVYFHKQLADSHIRTYQESAPINFEYVDSLSTLLHLYLKVA